MTEELSEEEAKKKLSQELLDKQLEELKKIFGEGRSSSLRNNIIAAQEEGVLVPYPEGDRQIYTLPINEKGNMVPSQEGTVSSIDREKGIVTIKHADGTTSRYQGVENIPESLKVGEEVTKNTELGGIDKEKFLYQRYKGEGNNKEFVVPGRDYMMLSADYEINHGHPPPQMDQSKSVLDGVDVEAYKKSSLGVVLDAADKHPLTKLGDDHKAVVEAIRSKEQLQYAEASHLETKVAANVRNNETPNAAYGIG